MGVVAVALASGASSSGAGSSIVGTTLQTQVLTRRPTIEGPPVGYTLALGVDGLGLRAMGAMVGTENIEWAREELATSSSFESVEKRAQAAPPGSEDLSITPISARRVKKHFLSIRMHVPSL